jgi:plasmid maintenance system killer protein
MSSAVFKYFISATPAQQAAMQVEIDSNVQRFWTNLSSVDKYDDMGDALLHALDEVLCGSSNYRQLLPPSSALRKNRTVVIVVLPDKVFWATVECVCNEFIIQDFGEADMPLVDQYYSDASTVYSIKSNLPYRLQCALQQYDTTVDFLSSTDLIQVVVKQLKPNTNRGLSSKAAGALTNACVKTMTSICDDLLPSSNINVDNNKKAGWRYSRKCFQTGRKYVVSRSAGKHLNAVLSCLEWMKANLPDFVRDRPLKIHNQGKQAFFEALRKAAVSAKNADSARLESIRLNKNAVKRFKYEEGTAHNFTKKVIGDLILISLNINQQYIRSVSDNYRHKPE